MKENNDYNDEFMKGFIEGLAFRIKEIAEERVISGSEEKHEDP